MANPNHVKILLQGVTFWNNWRNTQPEVKPDLRGLKSYDPEEKEVGEIPLDKDSKGPEWDGINFDNTDLSDADIWNGNFRRASLKYANLEGTKLLASNFEKASFEHANMQKCQLTSSALIDANFSNANLDSSALDQSDFTCAVFRRATLRNVELWRSILEGVSFEEADLDHCDVQDARYKRFGRCRGAIVYSCTGSRRFKRDVQDNDYLEEFRENRPLMFTLWQLSSDCGRSLFCWGICSVLLVSMFAVAFCLLGPEHFYQRSDSPLPFNLLTMMYYSVITFTTLGFGDIVPKTTLSAVLIVIEVLLGYLMLGGLISILSAKMVRRSE